jgi:RHS repeat-associated protein
LRYDAAGRLVHVLADDNTTVLVTHTYGEHRNRLSTYEGGLRTYYVWSAGAVIAEFVEHDTTPNQLRWSKNYVYFDGSLLAVQSAEGGDAEYLEFHHPDRLGSRLISSPTRGDQFEQTTLPFGNTFGAESGDVDRKAFAGYDRSFPTGLDYVVNRFYSAQQGRFTQVDPIGFGASSLDTPQSLNLYAYVNNDPVNQTDPDGLTGFLWPSFFSFGIGFGWGGQSGFGIRTIVNGQYFSNWFWFGGPPQPAPPPPPPPIIHTPVSSNTSSNSVSTGSVQTTTMTTDVDFSHVLSDEALSRERFMFATFVNASFQGDGYQSVVLPASEADLQKYMKHGPYLDGECAKFPQVVAWANLIKIGQTDTWKEGPRVVDSPRLQRGTIIASGWNANRRYPGESSGNHVAIFLYFIDPRDPFKGFAVIEQVDGEVDIDYKTNRQVNYYYSHPEWYAVVLTKPEKVEPPKPRTPAPARRGRGRRGE